MTPSGRVWLFPLAAPDAVSMRRRAGELADRAAGAGPEALAGVALEARGRLSPEARLRAAVVAGDGEELREGLGEIADAAGDRLAIGRRSATGCGSGHRIGFLFPGQGAPARSDAGAVGSWIPAADLAFAAAELPEGEPLPDELVQLSVVASSLAGLTAARALGIVAQLALGHSLGELVALHSAAERPS
jgi:enediyne polyketide synthase